MVLIPLPLDRQGVNKHGWLVFMWQPMESIRHQRVSLDTLSTTARWVIKRSERLSMMGAKVHSFSCSSSASLSISWMRSCTHIPPLTSNHRLDDAKLLNAGPGEVCLGQVSWEHDDEITILLCLIAVSILNNGTAPNSGRSVVGFLVKLFTWADSEHT